MDACYDERCTTFSSEISSIWELKTSPKQLIIVRCTTFSSEVSSIWELKTSPKQLIIVGQKTRTKLLPYKEIHGA